MKREYFYFTVQRDGNNPKEVQTKSVTPLYWHEAETIAQIVANIENRDVCFSESPSGSSQNGCMKPQVTD